MPDDYIKRIDALKAILGVSIYDAIEELEGARTIAENTWADGLWDAYKIIEEEVDSADVEPKRKWIPVTERLPENTIPVNIVWVNHAPASYYAITKNKPFVATGIFFFGVWYWWSATTEDYLNEYGRCEWDKVDGAIEITHWMPLPEPPKGEDE